MLLSRILPVAIALSLGATAPAHDGDDGNEGALRGEGALTAVVDGPQPGTSGKIEVESGVLRQKLEVDVRGADPAVALDVFLDDGTGTFTDLGAMVEHDGELELKIDTSAGGTLPLGVATVDLLAGLAVEVRDGTSAVVLTGVVPALGAGHEDAADDDDQDENHDGDHDGTRAKGVAALVRADTSPFPEARGRIEAESEGDEQSLDIEAEHLDGGTAVEFFLADEGGALTSIGTSTAGGDGDAEIEFETEDGGTLPLGAASVADLAGRRVEVRAADGTVLLFGEVPDVSTAALKLRARGDFRAADSKARVRITALVDGRAGRDRLNIELKAVARGAAEAEILLDDGGGTLTTAEIVPLRRSGRGRARYDTKKGDPLPLGAATVRDFAGRAFEIRVEGTAVLTGTFPEF